MTPSKLWIVPALAAAAIAVGAGLASAQIVVRSDDSYYDDERPTVVYRDYSVDREPAYRLRTYEYGVRPSGPNGCGTYYFWNGERCVDARNK
ncbi:MAG: hypothetical protein HC868_15420 [Sphingomonadales bacterium]|nr:hypothetical protein [Sphingomonadales bacterium]